MKRSLIKLCSQAILALILLISPAGSNTGTTAFAQPKITTEWVCSLQLKSGAVQQKKQQLHKSVSYRYKSVKFAALGKLKSNHTQWLNHSQPHTLLQKTIPFGTEDELSA